jgi:glycosyltransferase involved in cell wall biosynthesis
MKILYIAGQDMLARRQGSEVVCWHVAKELARHNDVYALNLGLGSTTVAPDTEVEFRVHSFKLASRLQKIFYWPLFQEGLRALRQEQYDVIVCNHLWAGIYGFSLSRLTGAPYVFQGHDVDHIIKRKTASTLEYLYSSIIEWLCCKTAKLVITVSKEDLDQLSGWIRHRGFASRLGVDTRVLNPYYTRVSHGRPTVLFFGNLSYLPNVQAVEEIYGYIAPAVVEQMPNVKFIIAGQNDRFTLEHPNVERVGFVPDIAASIKASDLVIVPLRMGGGMRLKIIESLACGKTVISTEEGVAGIPDRFHDLIICDLARFPQTIVEALQTRPCVSAEDFALISRKYSWGAVADEIQAEIEVVLYELERKSLGKPALGDEG